MSWGRVDSRDYFTPFSIFRAADVPSDFRIPPGLPEEFSGFFIPQENGTLELRRVPPRVLILTEGAVWILTRRSAEHMRIPLASLEVLECGRILLLGWITLHWNGPAQVLPYNRVGTMIVERFLNSLKVSWLSESAISLDPVVPGFEMEPDLKFCYAKSTELFHDEKPLVQVFHPAACRTVWHFGFRRETRSAGDLLVLSDRRLLWITDRHRAAYEPYGTVNRSAPISALVEVRSRFVDGLPGLDIALRSGVRWSVPLDRREQDEAKAFAEDATERIHVVTMSVPFERPVQSHQQELR